MPTTFWKQLLSLSHRAQRRKVQLNKRPKKGQGETRKTEGFLLKTPELRRRPLPRKPEPRGLLLLAAVSLRSWGSRGGTHSPAEQAPSCGDESGTCLLPAPLGVTKKHTRLRGSLVLNGLKKKSHSIIHLPPTEEGSA